MNDYLELDREFIENFVALVRLLVRFHDKDGDTEAQRRLLEEYEQRLAALWGMEARLSAFVGVQPEAKRHYGGIVLCASEMRSSLVAAQELQASISLERE